MARPGEALKRRSMTNVQVVVSRGDVAKALRRLKKKCEQSGVVSEMKRLEFYTSPGQKRRVEHRRAVKRMEKRAKKEARL
jgi:small subunit ribosomal protein S21